MNKELTGEPSFNEREDGDSSTGSQRPLKKARFAWQVKGKYHLKNETDEPNKTPTLPSAVSSELSSTIHSPSNRGSGVEDYLVNQDYSQLESVIDPDNSLLTPNTSILREHQQYPRYTSSYERKSNNMFINNTNSCNINTSSADNAEDQCIAQWQSLQMRKVDVDNTLNQALESWSNGYGIREDENSRNLAFDFAEFVNNFPGDNSVENEGILMAISAHGLQNKPSSSNDARYIDNCSTSSASVFDIPSPLQSPSPTLSDDDQQNDTDEKSPKNLQPWLYENQNASDATPFAYYSEPSHSPFSYLFSDNNQNSNIESNDQSDFDIMNTAILYAIKTKGLTVSGTEYG